MPIKNIRTKISERCPEKGGAHQFGHVPQIRHLQSESVIQLKKNLNVGNIRHFHGQNNDIFPSLNHCVTFVTVCDRTFGLTFF